MFLATQVRFSSGAIATMEAILHSVAGDSRAELCALGKSKRATQLMQSAFYTNKIFQQGVSDIFIETYLLI